MRYGTPLVKLREYLSSWGVRAQVVGKTPDLREYPKPGSLLLESPTRGREIWKWFDENGHKFDLESFVIIDDDGDVDGFQPNLVQTEFSTGITSALADRAIAILEKTK
jgi:hypothetical protein